MKAYAEISQYTVRGIDAQVDQALRRKAAFRKKSLNQLIVDELTTAAIGRESRADFSDLVGQWEKDPAFDKIIASQRQIDLDKWK